jgi:hypothetical protein
MSLLTFHRGLIAVAIAFCVGYGGWEMARHLSAEAQGSPVVGGIFLLLAGGLGWYLARLNRILGYEEEDGRPSR